MEKNHINLKADINEDIQHLEKSISNLEQNMDTLTKVMLQIGGH